jgi:hypothetical protein
MLFRDACHDHVLTNAEAKQLPKATHNSYLSSRYAFHLPDLSVPLLEQANP